MGCWAAAACTFVTALHLGLSSRLVSAALSQADYASLAESVGTVKTSDWTASRQYLFGQKATAIVTAGSGGLAGVPIVSAAKYGSGRVVHFGHESMMEAPLSTSKGLGRLLLNSAAWLAGGKTKGVRVAGATQWVADSLVASLAKQSPSRYKSLGIVGPASLKKSSVDIYVADGHEDAVGQQAAKIRQFLAAGGGLLIGSQAWYWDYLGKEGQTHPTNILLAPLGIVVAPESVQADGTMHTTTLPTQIGNVDTALPCLEAACKGKAAKTCGLGSDDAIASAMRMVVALGSYISFDGAGATFWAKLKQFEGAARNSASGIKLDNPIQRNSVEGLGALARNVRYMGLPPDKVPAAPDAKYFPGLPPAGTVPLAKAVSRTVNGDTPDGDRYWQCLGMYAMPGRAVTITVPDEVVTAGGAMLHIGGWTDLLYSLTEWTRLPDIVRRFYVTNRATKIASAHGGLIYLVLPESSRLGRLSVQVAGAITAPVYMAGSNKPSEWQNILKAPAPWGEIGSSKLIIATPASSLKRIFNPEQVVNYWDKVQDSNAALLSSNTTRAYPMRFQHDVAIELGYMHSGYPIMTVMDVVNTTITDPAWLRNKPGVHWGQFHELGHNHQQDAWTWGCTVEVTCNFFSARAMINVAKNTEPASFYGWNGFDMKRRAAEREDYFAAGPSHDVLCDNANLYLDSYLQVLEEGNFGLQLLIDTIASYKKLTDDEMPTNDDEKIQLWIKQQSYTAGVNFAPYYGAWGWPVAQETYSTLMGLPPLYPPT